MKTASETLNPHSPAIRTLWAGVIACAVCCPPFAYGQSQAAPPSGAVAPGVAPMAVVSPPPSLNAKMPPMDDMASKNQALSDAEDKALDAAKDTVKHLESTDSVSLEDLNAAHQMVAKIDALIDVEKHLSELEKLRSEREGSGRTLASAIPVSALRPPAGQPSLLPVAPMPGMSYAAGETDIDRIVGSDGHYSAIVKTMEGQRTVHAGDHLDGGKIAAIDATGVEIEQNGALHTLHVKNVDTVFGNAP